MTRYGTAIYDCVYIQLRRIETCCTILRNGLYILYRQTLNPTPYVKLRYVMPTGTVTYMHCALPGASYWIIDIAERPTKPVIQARQHVSSLCVCVW